MLEPVDYLRAGIAIHNEGYHHAAHDAWEDRWLDLEEGDEKDLLQGLIQFTAAVHHARERNWAGATGLAASAREYLADLDDDHDVNVGEVRDWLARLERDPELLEREPVLELTHRGEPLRFGPDFKLAAVAAPLVAEARGYDPDLLAEAATYGLADRADEGTLTQFETFVLDFLNGGDRLPVVVQRLEQAVERRRSRENDVKGLFD